MSITSIADSVSWDDQQHYVPIADVYSAIAHLEPFSEEEQRGIAITLNRKQYHPTNNVELDVTVRSEFYYDQVYTTVGDLKKFIDNLSEKLALQKNNNPVYITFERLDGDDESIQNTLRFGLTYDSTVTTVKHRVITIISDSITQSRKNAIAQKKREELLKEKELEAKQREADIMTLITRLQNKEITPEEFKTLSDAL